jgi:acyl-[acyl-carrier-protein]-phospholipid O-acyltransferase/long-chain-fatty-acid--[acyl-carrier-protein] ligase
VTVAFGEPLPSNSTAWQVRQAVQELGAACFELRKGRQRPLHRQFLRLAARHPLRPCLGDSSTPVMRAGAALVRTLVLARLLKRRLGDERMVGVLLPSTAAGALVNVALMLLGKVPVNLNYTVAEKSSESAIAQCGIRQVISSKLFLRKVKYQLSPEHVFLEDLRHEATSWDKIASATAFWLLPGWVLERVALGLGKHGIDDLATVIFSSGSTGEPKGVMLSQHNLVSNVEGVVQLVDLTSKDVLVGTLPFFHSFGFTVTIWVPLLIGAKVVYHPSPLDAKEIGELCRVHRATLFLATPTFLRHYLRRCGEDDFRSVRMILCGAEKLPQSLAEAFGEKFGVTPLEGYGCTELSPVVSANVPDFVQRGIRQVGNKPGTIGHPLPGVAAKIVDPDTFETLDPGREGLLAIKGPGVMMGYLAKPELTEEVIRDGWYMTGDIATIDADGFITITDRLSRFSKIGGEMVPHLRVEEKLHEIAGGEDHRFVVTSVPDERKGERLVVLHVPLEKSVEEIWNALRQSDLPNLWVPGRDAFYEVDEIPVLGSGKLDLKKVRALALEKIKRGTSERVGE